jgi:hypothetical protein
MFGSQNNVIVVKTIFERIIYLNHLKVAAGHAIKRPVITVEFLEKRAENDVDTHAPTKEHT